MLIILVILVILVFPISLVIQVILRSSNHVTDPSHPDHSILLVHANRCVLLLAYIAQFIYNWIRMERIFDQPVS